MDLELIPRWSRYAAAVTFELITIFLILPLFYGWWKLDSALNLSPFNIALAFNSPLLKNSNSASGARGVVRQMGYDRLSYGEVLSISNVFALPGNIAQNTTGRLGIDATGNVIEPRKGMQFSE